MVKGLFVCIGTISTSTVLTEVDSLLRVVPSCSRSNSKIERSVILLNIELRSFCSWHTVHIVRRSEIIELQQKSGMPFSSFSNLTCSAVTPGRMHVEPSIFFMHGHDDKIARTVTFQSKSIFIFTVKLYEFYSYSYINNLVVGTQFF